MSSLQDYCIKVTRPWSDLTMTRVDFALFTALNLAGWALLNVILGPYGPDRQAHAWALLQKGGFIAFALEWTYLSASFNRAADAGIEKHKFFLGYCPGRMLALTHVIVVPDPLTAVITVILAAGPVLVLLLCGTGRWLPGMILPTALVIMDAADTPNYPTNDGGAGSFFAQRFFDATGERHRREAARKRSTNGSTAGPASNGPG
ncbi:hypothetical protein [uncultured Alsobacter sp.]|uniref:hypothetical protein n=1 Tax=uncultured Alsobacter sp. TaxID=1748258 RepID=UPI0025F2FC52|nr:hypothetical protein [uncultured Alsobacter sp.]